MASLGTPHGGRYPVIHGKRHTGSLEPGSQRPDHLKAAKASHSGKGIYYDFAAKFRSGQAIYYGFATKILQRPRDTLKFCSQRPQVFFPCTYVSCLSQKAAFHSVDMCSIFREENWIYPLVKAVGWKTLSICF